MKLMSRTQKGRLKSRRLERDEKKNAAVVGEAAGRGEARYMGLTEAEGVKCPQVSNSQLPPAGQELK